MPALHLVCHPEALSAALRVAAAEDVLLLLGEATSRVGSALPREAFVLEEDMGANDPSMVGGCFTTIDYPGFVELVVTHKPVVTWR